MKTIDETIQVVPEIESLITSVQQPQTWIVLTEGWCRDAAQIVPVLHALAKLNSNIELRLLLRDDNLDLMDQYLTNGKSRSIPRLIAVDSDVKEELFNWGASPAIQQRQPDEKTIITKNAFSYFVPCLVYKKFVGFPFFSFLFLLPLLDVSY